MWQVRVAPAGILTTTRSSPDHFLVAPLGARDGGGSDRRAACPNCPTMVSPRSSRRCGSTR